MSVRTYSIATPPANLAWPAQGQAAVSLTDDSAVTLHGQQTPVPTASTAKLITALLILIKKPLALGQSGPSYTISANDVAIYNNYVAQGGSVLPVQTGEQLSEYQMLQALLLPSADNIADTLAIWAYGSQANYKNAANAFLKAQNLTHTHVGSDASGLAPDTTSTAADLVQIGKLVMARPVLAQIAAQPSAAGFPVVGTIKNVDFLLGNTGIVGIKTGNSDQAGGVFLGAAKTTVNGKVSTILSAVMGTPTLFSALSSSLALIQSTEHNFTTVHIYSPGQAVGTYTAPWGTSRQAVMAQDINITAWRGSPITATIKLLSIKASASQAVGTATFHDAAAQTSTTVPVNLQSPVPPPSPKWRLLHPLST